MKKRILKAGFDANVWGIFHTMSKNRLTVLNYHRINDPQDPDFCDFVPNVSATPALFASQMDYLLQRGFNFVSEGEILSWLETGEPLPPYAVLVTFDDGYEDNFKYAYPILRERKIPATIFLSTNHIGSVKPFYWDLIAYCLCRSPLTEINLPQLGFRQWDDKASLINVSDEWVKQIKQLPEDQKLEVIKMVPDLLEVSINEADFVDKHLSWDQVREMSNGGISFGGHTKSHPILTRVNFNQAAVELSESKNKIEQEIGLPVVSMAYPNGGQGDFSSKIIGLVKEAGYKMAFSLITGFPQYRQLEQQQYSFPRIYLGRKDTLPRFSAKIVPLTGWIDW